MKKDRNTEFNVKLYISVFLLHAGRPTIICLMFSSIDNEIEAFTCIMLWLLPAMCSGIKD